MATQGNLDSVNFNKIARPTPGEYKIPVKHKPVQVKKAEAPIAEQVEKALQQKEALLNRDSSNGRAKAIDELKERLKPRTLEELAEMLRKVNLTFDLFEIQTRYMVDLATGEVNVQIVNQRTGEVIRKIPPYDVPKFAAALKNGEPLVTDIKA